MRIGESWRSPVHATLNRCFTQDKPKLREESQGFETARFFTEFVFSAGSEQAKRANKVLDCGFGIFSRDLLLLQLSARSSICNLKSQISNLN